MALYVLMIVLSCEFTSYPYVDFDVLLARNRLLLIDVPLTTMIRMCYVVTFANLNLVIMVPQRLSPLCSSCMKARTLIFMGAMVFWLCYGTPSLESIIIENLSVVRELADVFHNDSWDFLPTREIEFWN
ncbi:hypothetical protein Tco_0073016 [Tanacetum coccineum]